MGIRLKLLSPLHHTAVAVHRRKSIWSEQQPSVPQAHFGSGSRAAAIRLLLFLLCIDILADPVHAIL